LTAYEVGPPLFGTDFDSWRLHNLEVNLGARRPDRFESRFAGYTFRNNPFIVQWFSLVNTSTIPALREGLMRAGLPILFVAFGQLCAVAVAQGQQEQPAALKQMLRNA